MAARSHGASVVIRRSSKHEGLCAQVLPVPAAKTQAIGARRLRLREDTCRNKEEQCWCAHRFAHLVSAATTSTGSLNVRPACGCERTRSYALYCTCITRVARSPRAPVTETTYAPAFKPWRSIRTCLFPLDRVTTVRPVAFMSTRELFSIPEQPCAKHFRLCRRMRKLHTYQNIKDQNLFERNGRP